MNPALSIGLELTPITIIKATNETAKDYGVLVKDAGCI